MQVQVILALGAIANLGIQLIALVVSFKVQDRRSAQTIREVGISIGIAILGLIIAISYRA